MASQLTDAFARKFYYLRLSITDVCNFRCTYCLPDGYKPGAVTNKGFLSVDEVRRVTRAFSALGTEKVRLTGGEPSLRRDFADIIAAVRENSAIRQIAVTTNGYRLARDVSRWRDAGLTAINVSVDSLDARQFHAITGQDKFHQVMDGIDAAFAAGFEKVKVNTVLMRDVNHHQLDTFLAWIQPRRIQLRFIELMETGEGSDLFRRHHISGMVLRDELLRRGWIHQISQRSDGPARSFVTRITRGNWLNHAVRERFLRQLQPSPRLLRRQAASVSVRRRRRGSARPACRGPAAGGAGSAHLRSINP